MVCATSKGSDQPAHTRSLIRTLACRLNILWLLTEHHLEFQCLKEAVHARLSLHMSKYHIVILHAREHVVGFEFHLFTAVSIMSRRYVNP